VQVTFWLLGSVACLALLFALAYWVPVSLSSSLQGRAEPSGSWAVAFGLAVGPIALSAIAAAGVAPFMTCHVFGRKVARLPLSRWRRRSHKPHSDEPKSSEPLTLSRFERALGRFFGGLDPLETALTWWHKERVFEVRSLVVDLDYSFRDVALTGRILAGMYVLSAVLPEHWQINQTPSWESEDRVNLAADARLAIWPVRLLLDLIGFVLEQRSRARHNAAPESG
jgi:hypothetical protein